MLLTLSVGGGLDTLETIYDSFRRNNPVVLVTGFGGVTDLLSLQFRVQTWIARNEKIFTLKFINKLDCEGVEVHLWIHSWFGEQIDSTKLSPSEYLWFLKASKNK